MPDTKQASSLSGDEPGFIRISEQEACVVRLMASGHGPERIASELRMSHESVWAVLRHLASRIEETRPATSTADG